VHFTFTFYIIKARQLNLGLSRDDTACLYAESYPYKTEPNYTYRLGNSSVVNVVIL